MQQNSPLSSLDRILEFALVFASLVVIVMWLLKMPLFYTDQAPVMSTFTALSLFMITGVRLCRRYLVGWPTALTLAVLGLVIGGNFSSLLMQTTLPVNILESFPDIVFTSVMTSLGLIIFCVYELLVVLRKTPQSAFILDDILLHLALVPGGISLLGYLLGNPTYLSMGNDPRVGISPLEMGFMATFAVTAVLSNPGLFLWQFLQGGWSNRFIFFALFANQFIAPVVVAYIFIDTPAKGVGLELFVMLAGVVATLAFLFIQAYLKRSED